MTSFFLLTKLHLVSLLVTSFNTFKTPSIVSSMSGKGEGKGKGQPRTGHKGSEVEKSYGSTLSLTSALDGGG